MSLDDIFGPFPGRPQHPDMNTMSEILLQMDGYTEDPDFNFEATLSKIINPDVLMYVATQRSLHSETAETGKIAAWLDGFIAGYKFHERRSS